MRKLLISIITINYNNKEGLRKTINSVVSQTYEKIQYIVIDGASTDGSVDVIKDNSVCIDYWISEPDKGIYHAMNKGLEKAKGDYLLFLNSGDCLTSYTIIKDIIEDLKSGEDIIFGLLKSVPSCRINYADVKLPLTLLDFYKYSPVPHPASFIRNKIIKELRYDESLKISSDWKFFLLAIVFKGCTCKKINKIVTDFEEYGISCINNEIGEKERIKVLKEVLPKCIYDDYFRFAYGYYNNDDEYDNFFLKIKKYRYGKLVYSLSVIFIRLVSLIKPNLRFSRNFPINLKK